VRKVEKIIFEALKKCNVCANELKKGDKVKDINPDCKDHNAKGKVKKINKIKDGKRIAGNVVEIEVENEGKNFKKGDKIKKTEIQLRKLKK
jgi:hypothetical protein